MSRSVAVEAKNERGDLIFPLRLAVEVDLARLPHLASARLASPQPLSTPPSFYHVAKTTGQKYNAKSRVRIIPPYLLGVGRSYVLSSDYCMLICYLRVSSTSLNHSMHTDRQCHTLPSFLITTILFSHEFALDLKMRW
jgi:hypothetical protein